MLCPLLSEITDPLTSICWIRDYFLLLVELRCFAPRFTEPLSSRGFLDFAHRLEFKIQENRAFRKLDLFPSSVEEEKDTYSVGSLRKS
jgi:hypothetical protein